MPEQPLHPSRPDRVGLRDWLRLARAVPSAWDLPKILVAAVGLIVLQVGWSAVDRAAPGADSSRVLEFSSFYGFPFRSPADFAEAVRRPAWNLAKPVRLLVEPMTSLFAIDGAGGRGLHSLLRLSWAIAVLSIVGGAICRIAVAEASTGERIRLVEAVTLAFRRCGALVAAPAHPLLIALGLGLISAGFGLAARLVPSLTVVLFVAPFFLGLATAILLLDLVASFPLLPAAVVTESETAVEAIGRCYNYVNHRPLTILAAVVVSWTLGTLGLAAFEVFLSAVMHLGAWGMGLAAFPARPGSIGGAIEPWAGVIGLACQAWALAFFWAAAARTYLLLRQDLDDVPSWGSAAARR